MEVIAILFSIPAAFFACLIYRWLLRMASLRWRWITPLFLTTSYLLLMDTIVEWSLLKAYGPVGTRARIGPGYYPVHLLIFFLAPAALVNLTVLHKGAYARFRWWIVAPLCTVFSFLLVLQQYSVSEALYGVDAHNPGPYSAADGH